GVLDRDSYAAAGNRFRRSGVMARTSVRVLLVEDNDHDAEIVKRMLGKYTAVNYVLERVRSTAECLDRMAAIPFDLLLLDYSLPAGKGLTFFRALTLNADRHTLSMLRDSAHGAVPGTP